MPKNRMSSKSSTGAITRWRPPHKFRIGTRSAGKSAILMSSEDLIGVLKADNKKRYHTRALAVLRIRNVDVQAALNPPVEAVAAEVV